MRLRDLPHAHPSSPVRDPATTPSRPRKACSSRAGPDLAPYLVSAPGPAPVSNMALVLGRAKPARRLAVTGLSAAVLGTDRLVPGAFPVHPGQTRQ
ncbi:MAG: hypothetical protein WKF73_20545 [Nocardioidaceae bacterium]